MECVLRTVKELIERMKVEIAKTQNVGYPEQIRVAEIYHITARTLCEACKRKFGLREGCKPEEGKKEVSLDTFILLRQLREDGLISESYYNSLFESLLEMKPELKEKVLEDHKRGLI